jgi:hypothetical protein
VVAADRVRVYLPASRDVLRRLQAGETWDPGEAFAVTPALRDDDLDADEEDLEFEAHLLAAGASLAALPEGEHRRVVVSADVAPAAVAAGQTPGAVRLNAPVTSADIAAVHVDDAAGAAVVAAVQGGGPAARLDDVALLWFAPPELDLALTEVTGTDAG